MGIFSKKEIKKNDSFYEKETGDQIPPHYKEELKAGSQRIIHALNNDLSEETDVIFITGTKENKDDDKIGSYDINSIRGGTGSLIDLLSKAAMSNDNFSQILITAAAVVRSSKREYQELDKLLRDSDKGDALRSSSFGDMKNMSDEEIIKMLKDI